jgi:aldose 1-epimerase
MYRVLSILFILIFCFSCNPKTEVNQSTQTVNTRDTLTVTEYGKMPDGRVVNEYTLLNANGMMMKVINYGGIITSLTMQDRNGKLDDVVLGYDSLGGYLKSNPYFGALIGRYGNRIAKGKFTLDNNQYTLATNNGENHLHGGVAGFDKVYWEISPVSVEEGPALKLSYQGKDMEEGYPGNLSVEVLYVLTNKNELRLEYRATTDKKTIVNLTQHTYFNLSGGSRDILDHNLVINADKYLPVDKTLIPTGEQRAVKDTPFDFTQSTAIGGRINQADEQLKFGKGYDHCWILNKSAEGLNRAAILYDQVTGREVQVFTSEPGIQFYSGNFLDGTLSGKKGQVYNFRTGLCLETQHFPDSPNRSEFPSVVLNPGEKYYTETIYRFAVR